MGLTLVYQVKLQHKNTSISIEFIFVTKIKMSLTNFTPCILVSKDWILLLNDLSYGKQTTLIGRLKLYFLNTFDSDSVFQTAANFRRGGGLIPVNCYTWIKSVTLMPTKPLLILRYIFKSLRSLFNSKLTSPNARLYNLSLHSNFYIPFKRFVKYLCMCSILSMQIILRCAHTLLT